MSPLPLAQRLYLAQRHRLMRMEREELVRDLVTSGPLGLRSAIMTPELGDVAPELLADLAPEKSIRAAAGPLRDPSMPFTIKRHIVRVLVEILRRSPSDGAPSTQDRAKAAVAIVSRDWGPPNVYHRRLNLAAVTMVRAAAGLEPAPDTRAMLRSELDEEVLSGLSLAALADDRDLLGEVLRLRDSAKNDIAYAASRALEVLAPGQELLATILETALRSGSRRAADEATRWSAEWSTTSVSPCWSPRSPTPARAPMTVWSRCSGPGRTTIRQLRHSSVTPL